MTAISQKRNLIRGALWSVGARWVIKSIGFVNTIIMARLLMPADYGIVAMGMLVVGIIRTFLDFGATIAILRKDKVSAREVDSAWTLRVIQGVLAGIALVTVTPLAIKYFGEPRLQYVLWTFAVSVIFASLSSMGPTLALKSFDFSLSFKIDVIAKFAGVLATLIFGLLLHDYRALVIGIAVSHLAPMVLGYSLHPYRPRWDTSEIGQIWAITKWLMLGNIGTYVLRNGDQFIAGRMGSTVEFGLYNVGSDLGQMPVAEVGPAMTRAILPVLSPTAADRERTNNSIVKITATVNGVVWPLGLGFLAIATQATELLLGQKWLGAVPFVQLFAIVAILQTTTSSARSLLIIQGHTRTQSQLVGVEFGIFALASLVLTPYYNLIGLAVARGIASAVSSGVVLLMTNHHYDLSARRMLYQIARPMTGAVLMATLVIHVTNLVNQMLLQVVVGIIVGTIFYALWCLISWRLSGRPEGLESTVIEYFFTKKNKR